MIFYTSCVLYLMSKHVFDVGLNTATASLINVGLCFYCAHLQVFYFLQNKKPKTQFNFVTNSSTEIFFQLPIVLHKMIMANVFSKYQYNKLPRFFQSWCGFLFFLIFNVHCLLALWKRNGCMRVEYF